MLLPLEKKKKIEALEKRVQMLERLLNQQVRANKVAARQAASSRQVRPAPKQVVIQAPPQPAFSQDKKIHLGGVTITPGGFFAGEGVFRSRNEQTDIGSTFSGIPLGNSPLLLLTIKVLPRETNQFPQPSTHNTSSDMFGNVKLNCA